MSNLYRRIPEYIRSRIALRMTSREEIHIEQIETTFQKLASWLRHHPETRLMLTFTPKRPTERTLDLYRELTLRFPNSIGLHVHICDDLYSPPLPLPSTDKQYERINTGLKHLNSLGLETMDFTSGHWSYDEGTLMACKRIGLTNIHVRCKYIPDLSEKYGIPKGIRLIPVVKHLHDYDI